MTSSKQILIFCPNIADHATLVSSGLTLQKEESDLLVSVHHESDADADDDTVCCWLFDPTTVFKTIASHSLDENRFLVMAEAIKDELYLGNSTATTNKNNNNNIIVPSSSTRTSSTITSNPYLSQMESPRVYGNDWAGFMQFV